MIDSRGSAQEGEKVGDGQQENESKRWARREAVQGSGGSGTVVWCRRRKSMGLGHWPLPYSPSMRVSLVLASCCQSQNIIAADAGPDSFTCEALLCLLSSAVDGLSGWCIRLRSWA